MKTFWQSNTIRVALAAILAAWAAYFGGQLELNAAVMSSVGAVLAIFLRKGAGIPIAPVIVILCLVVLSGCATPPAMETGPGGLATKVDAPKSGDAESKATDVTTPFGPAFSYMGDAEALAVAAAYKNSRQVTGTGSLVTGFVMGITAEQGAAIQKSIDHRLKTDIALVSMTKELADLGEVPVAERDPEWESRVDGLRVMYREAAKGIVETMDKSGQTGTLDLQKLETLVVVGIVHSAIGEDEKPPTEAESESLPYILSNIVAAARGESVIVPPGGKMEEAPEDGESDGE